MSKWERVRDDLSAIGDLVELVAYKTYGYVGALFRKSALYKYDVNFDTMGALMDFHLSASIFNFFPNRIPYAYDQKSLRLVFYANFAHKTDLDLALRQSIKKYSKSVSVVPLAEVTQVLQTIKDKKPDNFVVLYSSYKAMCDGRREGRMPRTIRVPVGLLITVALVIAINALMQYLNAQIPLPGALGIGIGAGAAVSTVSLLRKRRRGIPVARIFFESEQGVSAFLKVLDDMKRWMLGRSEVLPMISSGSHVTLVGCSPENAKVKKALESFRGACTRNDGYATDDEVYTALKSTIEEGSFGALNRKLRNAVDKLPASRRDELRTLILVNGDAGQSGGG